MPSKSGKSERSVKTAICPSKRRCPKLCPKTDATTKTVATHPVARPTFGAVCRKTIARLQAPKLIAVPEPTWPNRLNCEPMSDPKTCRMVSSTDMIATTPNKAIVSPRDTPMMARERTKMIAKIKMKIAVNGCILGTASKAISPNRLNETASSAPIIARPAKYFRAA